MKHILVTGANKGIGLGIVQRILTEHWETFVHLGSRDRERGEAARRGLVDAHPEWAERLAVVTLDVTRDESVRAAASAMGDQTLYGLVNNAGIGFGIDDLSTILDVNVRGIRRVCESFAGRLESGGRIVNVTSAAGPMFVAKCSAARQQFLIDPAITWEALEGFMAECLSLDANDGYEGAGLAPKDHYGISKACANAYTQILARERPNLGVNAVTPGFIATDLTTPFAEARGQTPQEMGMKTPYEGALAPTHLLFAELEGSGRYYGSDAVRSPLDKYRGPGDPPYTGD